MFPSCPVLERILMQLKSWERAWEVNEPVRYKLGKGRKSWQRANRAWPYHDLLRALYYKRRKTTRKISSGSTGSKEGTDTPGS